MQGFRGCLGSRPRDPRFGGRHAGVSRTRPQASRTGPGAGFRRSSSTHALGAPTALASPDSLATPFLNFPCSRPHPAPDNQSIDTFDSTLPLPAGCSPATPQTQRAQTNPTPVTEQTVITPASPSSRKTETGSPPVPSSAETRLKENPGPAPNEPRPRAKRTRQGEPRISPPVQTPCTKRTRRASQTNPSPSYKTNPARFPDEPDLRVRNEPGAPKRTREASGEAPAPGLNPRTKRT